MIYTILLPFEVSAWKISLTIPLLAIASFIGLCVYRVTLHPLAKFPGRRLAAATGWYEFYFDVVKAPGGQYSKEVAAMHEKYGPIVRINPHELHVRDTEFATPLYAPLHGRRNKYEPAARFGGTPLSSFGAIPHDLHRKRRAPISIMFSRKAVYGPAQTALCGEIKQLCTKIDEMHTSGEVREIRSLYLAFASCFSAGYFFDGKLNYLENRSALEDWHATIKGISKNTPVMRQFPWLPEYAMMLPAFVQTALAPDLAQLFNLHRFCQQRASDFLRQLPAREAAAGCEKVGVKEGTDIPATLFDAIIQSSLPPEEKSFGRLWQETFAVFFGSTDTTSRTMTSATYYLLSSPHVLKNLRTELDKMMPEPADALELDYARLDKHPLLTAILKETMRMQDLVTGRIPAVPLTELRYGRWSIPSGTPVSISMTDVMTSAKVFPEPEKFIPDRWLENGKLHTKLDEYFLAFGRGQRMCQGMDIGWAMMYRVLSTIFRRYEIELVDMVPERDMKIVSDCFFGDYKKESKGVRIKVTALRS